MYLLVNQYLIFLFNFIKLYSVFFFLILHKIARKIPNSGGRVMFQKWGEKNTAVVIIASLKIEPTC